LGLEEGAFECFWLGFWRLSVLLYSEFGAVSLLFIIQSLWKSMTEDYKNVHKASNCLSATRIGVTPYSALRAYEQ
jgi:hypothetical protein